MRCPVVQGVSERSAWQRRVAQGVVCALTPLGRHTFTEVEVEEVVVFSQVEVYENLLKVQDIVTHTAKDRDGVLAAFRHELASSDYFRALVNVWMPLVENSATIVRVLDGVDIPLLPDELLDPLKIALEWLLEAQAQELHYSSIQSMLESDPDADIRLLAACFRVQLKAPLVLHILLTL